MRTRQTDVYLRAWSRDRTDRCLSLTAVDKWCGAELESGVHHNRIQSCLVPYKLCDLGQISQSDSWYPYIKKKLEIKKENNKGIEWKLHCTMPSWRPAELWSLKRATGSKLGKHRVLCRHVTCSASDLEKRPAWPNTQLEDRGTAIFHGHGVKFCS